MRIRDFLLALSILACAAGPAAAAQPSYSDVFEQRFQIYLGIFVPQTNSDIKINGEVLPPVPGLDFEDVFGLEDSKTVGWGGARWHISRRNHLEFEFFKLDRNGTRTGISEPIQVGDSIIQAGAQVDSSFDMSLGRLTYGFSVIQKERLDFQVKAGLHIVDLSAAIQAFGEVCVDGETPPCQIFVQTPQVESESVTAPLPHLGLSFGYAITPSVAARLQALVFALEVDNIKGSLFEFDADVVWNPWEHVGFGLGMRMFQIKVEASNSELDGEFDFNYWGPTVYVIGSF